jgi:glycosyltransferase involved in cell wall biosynthesis
MHRSKQIVNPIKVLHVFGRMQPGGAELRLLDLIGRLPPFEFRVDVCALSGAAGPLDAAVRSYGGDVRPLRLNARFPLRFVRLLRRGRYDVVHSHVLYASGPILALAAAAGIPVRVAHFHSTRDGQPTTWRRQIARGLMSHLIARCATDIIACGEGAMDAMWPAWRGDRRCRVIYDALDLTRFEQPVDRLAVRSDLGIAVMSPLFVHVGNQMPEKNHERLLGIFAAIQRAAPASRLLLVGAGTDEPQGAIARWIQSCGLEGSVLTLGVRHDVPRLLSAADALLLPSLHEGLPGVVLEACAAGVPVLASDLPGVREIASRLALVKYLPLGAADRAWADAALALPAEAERMNLRDRAREAFRPSVFHVDRAVEAHRTLWQGGCNNTASACS